MSNRCKAAILLGILSFYIILSAMETAEYNKKSGHKHNAVKDEEIIVGDQKMNLSDFFNNTNVKTFKKQLHGIGFSGEWEITSNENSKLFSEISIPKGRIELEFENDILSLNDSGHSARRSKNSTIQVKLMEGYYQDERTYGFELSLLDYQAFNFSTSQFSFSEKPVNITMLDRLEEIDVFECNVGINLDLNAIIHYLQDESKSKYKHEESLENVPVPFYLVSSDCGFEVKSTLYKDPKDLEKKTINYSVLLTFIAILQLYSIAKMIKSCLDSPTKASQISLMTIGFILIWDTYICLAHLFTALRIEKLFHFFIMPTFWYFILFSIFETKLLFIIWKARYGNQYPDQEQSRRALSNFYFKLYSGMIIILYLLYEYALYNWFLLLMSLYLVPQIIHNAMKGGRIEFDPNYMFNIIGLRVLLPLYFRGCPENLMQLRPSFIFCSGLIAIVGVQIMIVYYQAIYGSKFFVPARFLPEQYNYLVDVTQDIETGGDVDDCAICMQAVHQPVEAQTPSNPHSRMVLSRLRAEKNHIMKTPCNHKFHVSCLVEWMSIKMECPTCRSALPVLE